ncbi:TetR/AcrR family transcriptional regulator [Staphylococcus massiliensis]|uniref:TetR/AcrR family transcriptional regulator n=1 Tax=Staphylococcus massiliensis TaxID=555791 RepID=UPI001EDF3BF0|nr:TetR/AcrR family transcriptional regulator [Staphylococcus massiliensis]MCG3400353.1 TetR/AcrR family transcriptional regulator [Staphylococcus massiliensis]
MNNKDLRVIKTKKALSEALFKLLTKHEFSTVSVNQICREALVHRTTFYKHFYDKYDLLLYLFKEKIEDYFKVDLKTRINAPFTSFMKLMDENTKNVERRQMYDAAFRSTLVNHFIDLFKKDIKDNVSRISVDPKVPEDAIFYIYGGLLSGMTQWVDEYQVDKTPSELDDIFHRVVNLEVKD